MTQSSLYSVVASSIAEVARDLGIYDSTLGELGAQPRTEREPGVDTPTPMGNSIGSRGTLTIRSRVSVGS